MGCDLDKLTVAEIRQYCTHNGAALTPQLLNRLRRDPRQGVRNLYKELQRRLERQRNEQARLDALLNFERILWKSGVDAIAGVDEAGVGPLAGPVVAAAVVFPPDIALSGIDDSKRLNTRQRTMLAERIHARAAGVGIGVVEVDEIDTHNIYQASLIAMRRAVEALPKTPQHLLVDARTIPDTHIPQNPFNKGDGINYSIAAASIIAKTHRDRLMAALDRQFTHYGFAHHKGYGTNEHRNALREYGPCPAHRRSFAVIRELCGHYSARFYTLQQQCAAARTTNELRLFEQQLKVHGPELDGSEARKLRLMSNRRWKTI